MQKTKNKDGALEKNVDYQFEFPRQCIVQKNALSLTQAPMICIKREGTYSCKIKLNEQDYSSLLPENHQSHP